MELNGKNLQIWWRWLQSVMLFIKLRFNMSILVRELFFYNESRGKYIIDKKSHERTAKTYSYLVLICDALGHFIFTYLRYKIQSERRYKMQLQSYSNMWCTQSFSFECFTSPLHITSQPKPWKQLMCFPFFRNIPTWFLLCFYGGTLSFLAFHATIVVHKDFNILLSLSLCHSESLFRIQITWLNRGPTCTFFTCYYI